MVDLQDRIPAQNLIAVRDARSGEGVSHKCPGDRGREQAELIQYEKRGGGTPRLRILSVRLSVACYHTSLLKELRIDLARREFI